MGQERNVQNLHIAGSDKPVRFYSLDVVIRSDTGVKSIHGTRFRQWATSAQREHLVRGYTLSPQRLEQNSRELESQNEQLLVGVLWESVVLSSASS